MSKLDILLDNNLNILNSEYNLTYERANSLYNLDMELDLAKKTVL